MATTLRAELPTLPRRNVARAALRGEAAFNFLERANLGPVIAGMLGILRVTADRMGRDLDYPDGTIVSKWINNAEPPQVIRICSYPNYRAAFIEALADATPSLKTKKVIEIERTA